MYKNKALCELELRKSVETKPVKTIAKVCSFECFDVYKSPKADEEFYINCVAFSLLFCLLTLLLLLSVGAIMD